MSIRLENFTIHIAIHKKLARLLQSFFIPQTYFLMNESGVNREYGEIGDGFLRFFLIILSLIKKIHEFFDIEPCMLPITSPKTGVH